jgi:hypothetical protein
MLINNLNITYVYNVVSFIGLGPPVSSTGQSLATDPDVGIRFPALPAYIISGFGTGSTQPREYN